MNFEHDYNVEEEVSYLLDKQSQLIKKLERYNGSVSLFEDKRDNFFKSLYNKNQIKELKEAIKVFDKVAYVETDKPDFIFVNVTDIYDAIPVVEDEYDIIEVSDYEEAIEVEETNTTEIQELENDPEELSDEDINRVLKEAPKKDYIFRQILEGKNKCYLYKEKDNTISIGSIKYSRIRTGTNNDSPICKYREQLFNVFKQHYDNDAIIKDLGIKPVIDEANRRIICEWA